MRRVRFVSLVVLLGATTIVSCSREEGLRCQAEDQHAASRTAPPVRVPEGLTVPDESEALTIPPAGNGEAEREEPPEDGCLERPPDYFEGGEP